MEFVAFYIPFGFSNGQNDKELKALAEYSTSWLKPLKEDYLYRWLKPDGNFKQPYTTVRYLVYRCIFASPDE